MDISNALRQAYLSFDKKALESRVEYGQSGSTALVAVIYQNSLYVANTGDCQLIVGRRKKADECIPQIGGTVRVLSGQYEGRLLRVLDNQARNGKAFLLGMSEI